MASAPQLSSALRRQHGGIADRRNWPAAVDCVWTDPHCRWLFQERISGNSLFTLLGFMGMYSVLSVLFIVLVYRTIDEGPAEWAGIGSKAASRV